MMGEGWKKVRLGDVVTAIRGGGTPDKSNSSYWNGDIPWVSVKDLKGNILLTTEDSITEAGLSESASNAFDANTIVIATRMAVGATVKLGKHMAINQDLKAIFPSDEVNSDYLYRYLQMSAPRLAALGTGSTVKGITLGDLRRLVVSFPKSHVEQQRITNILSTWDRAIELTSALLDAARTRKRELMQILLTGKCRFPEFEGQMWREVRLGEVASVDQQSLRSSTAPDLTFDYVSLSDVKSGQIVESLQRFTFEEAPSRARRVIKSDDLLVSTVRPNLQGFARATERHQDCIASTGFAVVIPKPEAKSSYLFHYFFSHHMKSQFHSLVVGSNYLAINSSDVRRLKICLPSLTEQAKIGNLLDGCDAEIVQLVAQIKNLRIQKRGLMQKLLTGEWRVPLGSANIPMHTGGWSCPTRTTTGPSSGLMGNGSQRLKALPVPAVSPTRRPKRGSIPSRKPRMQMVKPS